MIYTINGKEYETWSINNQRILDKLVDREVYCCMTSEMEYMLSRIWQNDDNNPFDESDYENLLVKCCSECDSSCGFEELTVSDLNEEDIEKSYGYIDAIDDYGDGFACPICGAVFQSAKQAKECCDKTEIVYKCQNCGKLLNEEEYEQLDTRCEEVYEWWAVSKWFGEKLAEHDCVVIESWGKSYWGRSTTGQSISLDGCVIDIAKEMGILEGMEFEWKV